MNSEMLFDSLYSLELRWFDLAASFERLAQSLPTSPPGLIPLAAEIGRTLKDAAPQRDSLQDRAVREADAIRAARVALQDDSRISTADLLDRPVGTAGPDGAVQVFQTSDNRSDTGRSIIQTEFIRILGLLGQKNPHKGDEDTLEMTGCRQRLDQLKQFIARSLRNFFELKDGSGFTQRFDIRGIRGSVDNLSAYPLLTSEMGGHPLSSGSSGAAGVISLRRTVQTALREVIGRNPKPKDAHSFLTALEQSFQSHEIEGRVEYTWMPRSYAGQTELGGGVTGGQASLAARAQVALKYALPLLEGLYSLREDADPELVEATRSLVRNEFTEVVDELGVEGGPRIARVDNLFGLLLAQEFNVQGRPTPVLGHLGLLSHELGLTPDRVNTLEEETNLTNFIALSDYLKSVHAGWLDFRNRFGKDLGTRFVLLQRALTVAADAVEEIQEAMDSVFVGEAERQVASFRDENGNRVHVGELLSWIVDFAADEAPRLVHEGGRRGVESLIPTAHLLATLVDRFLRSLNFETDLPDGMRQPRVVNPVRELRGHLGRIERLASDVRNN